MSYFTNQNAKCSEIALNFTVAGITPSDIVLSEDGSITVDDLPTEITITPNFTLPAGHTLQQIKVSVKDADGVKRLFDIPDLATSLVIDSISSDIEIDIYVKTSLCDGISLEYAIYKETEEAGSHIPSSGGGSTPTPKISPTKEILKSGATQEITLKGINIDQITTISLTDADVIDLGTDFLLIDDNTAVLTVTMNGTVGLKELDVNGVLYPNWIESKVNAGFTLYGTDYNHTPVALYDDSGELEVYSSAHDLRHYAKGFRLGIGNGLYRNYVKMNDFFIDSTQTVEIIIGMNTGSKASDVINVGLIKASENPKATTARYSADARQLGCIFLKDYLTYNTVMSQINFNKNGVSSEMWVSQDANVGGAVDYNFSSLEFTKILMNKEKISLYRLKDNDDLQGELMVSYLTPTEFTHLENLVPIINVAFINRAHLRIMGVRKTQGIL